MSLSQKVGIALAAAVSSIMLAGAPALADTSAYLVDSGENLVSFDATTGTFTQIGNTGQFLEGLALSPGGVLYGTDSGGQLFSINRTTGAATAIGSTGLGNIEGLSFNGNTLVGTSFAHTYSLYTIDTSTATPTLLVNVSGSDGPARSMEIKDANTALVATDSPTFPSLESIDLTTGVNTVLGTLSANGAYGLAFLSDGNLYGAGGTGDISLINPSTGASTFVANDPGEFFLDMTGIPASTSSNVPEPSAVMPFAVAALGLLGLTLRARRVRAV